MSEKQKRIRSFRDLEVYQSTYNACIRLMTKILPKLPESEKYDLKDQLSKSVKAIPRLIAEGYAKRHQKLGFQKYLDDAMAECNDGNRDDARRNRLNETGPVKVDKLTSQGGPRDLYL